MADGILSGVASWFGGKSAVRADGDDEGQAAGQVGGDREPPQQVDGDGRDREYTNYGLGVLGGWGLSELTAMDRYRNFLGLFATSISSLAFMLSHEHHKQIASGVRKGGHHISDGAGFAASGVKAAARGAGHGIYNAATALKSRFTKPMPSEDGGK